MMVQRQKLNLLHQPYSRKTTKNLYKIMETNVISFFFIKSGIFKALCQTRVLVKPCVYNGYENYYFKGHFIDSSKQLETRYF